MRMKRGYRHVIWRRQSSADTRCPAQSGLVAQARALRRWIAGGVLTMAMAAAHAQPVPAQLAVVEFDPNSSQAHLFGVDPSTSARRVISSLGDPAAGPTSVRPSGVAFEATGNILVVDPFAPGNHQGPGNPAGALFRVDPNTGARTVLSDFDNPAQGRTGGAPLGIAVDANAILVIDNDAITAHGALFRIDPATGFRQVVSDFGNPAQGVFSQGTINAVAIDGAGNYLVADDQYGQAGGDFRGAVFRIDPTSGIRRVVSDFNNPAKGPLGADPVGVAVDGAGAILVTDRSAGTGARGALFGVDPANGQRTLVSDFGDPAQGPLGGRLGTVSVDAAGNIWVVDLKAGTDGRGALFSVNPSTGARSLVTDFGNAAQGEKGVAAQAVASAPVVPTAPVDLGIASIEITQAIQNFANDVPLVQDKATFARVYPTVDTDTRRVGARLRGFRNGVELPGSPLRPLNPSVTVRPGGFDRGAANDSFNFFIPPSWRSGNVSFQAEINFGAGVPETDFGNNVRSVAKEFVAKAPVCVVMIPVRTHGSLYTVDSPGFDNIINRFKSLWPVPDAWVYYQSSPVAELQPRFGIPPWEFGPYELPDDGSWVIAKLMERDLFTDDPDECDDANARTHYVGMVSQDTSTGRWAGLGSYEFAASWVKMSSSRAEPFATPSGGSTMAHELSHNYNGIPIPLVNETFLHVQCPASGPNAPTGINSNYPYPKNAIGPLLPDAYWGFDSVSRTIVRPSLSQAGGAADYMSYCAPKWVSDYTWKHMFDVINSGTSTLQALSKRPGRRAAVPGSRSGGSEMLVVNGVIAPASNKVQFELSIRLPQAMSGGRKVEQLQAKSKGGPRAGYVLQLLGEKHQQLSSTPFTTSGSYEGDPLQVFGLAVPFDPRTRYIRVARADGHELGSLTVSPNAPRVTIIEPAGGATITDKLTVRWEGSDADNDPLRYTVQYSADQGAHWQSLVSQSPETTLTIEAGDLASIPGSAGQALIRVIANDGVNAGADTSAPFTVARRAPHAHIETPGDGSVVAADQQLVLNGNARDPEDGPLADNALRWQLDNQVVGAGRELAVAGLTPGVHVITLGATDSDGTTGTASVTITVAQGGLVANVDGYTVHGPAPLSVPAPGVLGNDLGTTTGGLRARLVRDVGKGRLTLGADGAFVYTPKAGFCGPDSFAYVASDGTADSNVVTVNLLVTDDQSAQDEPSHAYKKPGGGRHTCPAL